MIEVYILINLLSQVRDHGMQSLPQLLSTVSAFSSAPNTRQLDVHFDRLNGVRVGTPVYAAGEIVGNVAEISQSEKAAREKGPSSYAVRVTIRDGYEDRIHPGVVALLSCPLSAQRGNTETAVELLTLPNARELNPAEADESETLSVVGYSSYEQFWGSSFHPLKS